jgi:hypothetical protein
MTRSGATVAGLSFSESSEHGIAGVSPRALRTSTAVVEKGSRRDGILALFPENTSFEDVVSVTVRVDGANVVVPGRYFTLAEKRAIDRARARRP